MKLTHKTVEAARCPSGRKDVLLFDSGTRGFGLRVTAGGGKSFLAQYSTPTGKRRLPLGSFGAITVEQARRAAKAILGDVARGLDPAAERAKEKKKAAPYLVRALVEEWARAREGDRRSSYLREAVLCVRRNLSDWLDLPAAEITLGDAVRALDRVRLDKGIVAANRTLAYARAAFGWAARRQAIPANPLKGIERPGRETSRERVLAIEEMGAIWRAARELGWPFGAFVRVLMLTLQRRGEVAGATWDEIAAGFSTWTLPAARTKNGRPHVVHLPEPARVILHDLSRFAGNPHVFAGRGAKPIAAFNSAKAALDRHLAAQGTPLDPWTLHDFRRSGVTWLAGAGFPPHVCDKLLNHVTGTISGVAAVYQRAEFLPERARALDAWAAAILAAAEGKAEAENVVALRG